MKLLFQEQTTTFEQTPTIEEIIETINELLQDNYYFSHLIADGKEIVEDPEVFLTKHVKDIDSIEVIAVVAKQFINDLLLSTEEYTERAVLQLATLTDEFYNNPTASSWTELGHLFEGIQWLVTMIDTVDQSTVRPAVWGEVLTHSSAIQEELATLEEALENTDTVLIADLLQYELLPAFEEIAGKVKDLIDTEGTRPNLN